MAGLKTLNAQGLPASFDLDHHGEKPIITMTIRSDAIHLTFTFPGYRLSHAPGKKKAPLGDRKAFVNEIGISGTGFLSEGGKPLLPSFGRFVQIPPGHHYTIQVKKGPFRRRRNMRIRPAQENVTDQQAGEFEFEEGLYREDKFYPQELVDIGAPLFMDGYRVVCLHVRPFQYNPVRELLHCYSNIEVTINLRRQDLAGGLQETNRAEVPLWTYLDRTHRLDGFGNFIFNPDRKIFDAYRPRRPPYDPPSDTLKSTELLIIYSAPAEKAARKLKAWKQKLGLDTATVPVAEIFDPDGDDKAARIRKLKTYIRGHRGQPRSVLRYVLLFGDTDVIPAEEHARSGRTGTALTVTTDFYYFTHRDALDQECLLPWVAGGRIPSRTAAEGLSAVDQIIRYEQTPPEDPAYYNRLTVAAYYEDCGKTGRQDGRAERAYLKTMETIRTHMISRGFEVSRVYVTNNLKPTSYADGTAVPPKVRAALIDKRHNQIATKMLLDRINAGQLIMGHRGHGSRAGWQQPPLKTDDLSRISSTNPSVFFSINCRTGSFDSGRGCFAEVLLARNGGAPTLIAATELSGSWRNDSMIKALFDAIWPGILPTYPATTERLPVKYGRMGDIMNYAKAFLLTAHGDNASTQKHFEIYHIVGDPTMQIWGSVPLKLRLRARIRKDILLVDMNTCPQDAVLSVWYEGNCLRTLKPSETRLALPLQCLEGLPPDALHPGRDDSCRLTLYFTAPGHRLAVSDLWF